MEIQFARILSVLGYKYFHGEKDTELLKIFMSEPYMQDESLSKDFSTKYLFQWVHAHFEEFKGNHEEALNYFSKSIKVWLDNPTYIEAHPRMYLGACFMFFRHLIHQKEPFSTITKDINFDVLFSKINVEGQSREGTERYTGLFQLVNIIRLRQKLQFKEIIEVISDSSIGPNYEDSLSDYGRVIYYYYAALANIEIGNHQGANDFLFDLLNPLDKRLATNPVYTSVFVLLHLIVLAEISNAKHIGYLLPKYKKYLQKTDRLGAFEEHFISMFAQLISPRYKYNLESVYSRFLKRLKQAREEDDRGLKLEYEYLISWVERKCKDME